LTQLIPPSDFDTAVTKLRSFFSQKGYTEVHTQNRLSILAACEDPTTVATYTYNDEIWPLPQTGQMWLEYELLTKPELQGCFCVSTSFRQEQNPVAGRHDTIFPMFEFESVGNFKNLISLEQDLCRYLQFGTGAFPVKTYNQWCHTLDVKELDHAEEATISNDHESGVGFITHFPYETSPFWNMKRQGDVALKCDVIIDGMETIGSAERSTNVEEMHKEFHEISNGEYAELLYNKFGEARVEAELEEFLKHDFVPRFGGGIGMTRMISALKNVPDQDELINF
jgi:aspartyl/asparaginyl-tRNA synthetase